MGGAAAEPTPGKGGKKSLDAAINLVPYIDMLMTIMTFLMMTAVWTQIAMLEVQNASGGPPDQEQEEKDEEKPKPIIVLITENALKIQEEGGELKELPSNGDQYDLEGAKATLKALKDAKPERVEVKIQAEDGVKYEDIVKVIDTATGLQLTAITLTPVGT